MQGISKAALAAMLASCAFAAPAMARDFDKVVAFGDSYADIGNVAALAPGLFNFTVYPTGRFSGGTNFVDTLATHYGVPEANFAFGGAQAGSANIASPLLPGFAQEVQLFETTAPGTFSPDDLLAMSVGGNDARAYRIGGGTLAGVDAATTQTATDAITGVRQLVGKGAKHIVWIAGDAGQLPEALGQPSAAVGTAFSDAYNAKMQALLAPIANNGVQIAYVDITTIGNVVRADPGRFGFMDVTTACPLTCIGNPALQQQYFFYVDGVHLTSAAFDLVGRYAVNQLEAPYSFRANGDLVNQAAQDFSRTITGRLDLARGSKGPDGLSVYLQGTGNRSHYDFDATSDGYRTRSWGAAGGVEWKQAGLTAGGIFSWTKSHADSSSVAGDDAHAKSYQVGGYAAYDTGSLFAQVYGGYGWHHLDIHRTGVADPLTAHPHATSIVAGGRAGWLVPTGMGRIGPVAGIAWAHAKLDGYTEAGDAAAALVVNSQKVDTVVGSAGLEWRPDLGPAITPWLRATAEKSVHGDKRDLLYAPADAATVINRFEISSASDKVYGDVAGGISARIGSRVALEGTVHTTFSRAEGNDYGGFAGVKFSL
ncbi:autotransporter domain-containing protein [Sphingomonas sp. CGMCC 1.13654]|uniref:Autotransporter domain-containing protein n=1 Tax=Sphingomonas chungangi TaxID=2683589 RepID=A0A838KYY5_9SPHN|nr:autotransporter domain-containing protein [Sphingomonas chungangi]MBA2932483.1 autotransporter domain-containing protein [Sphingomonas chungangi]MVW56106.1 autotransporter domain-containing protein [Sphingomonas chungangi]